MTGCAGRLQVPDHEHLVVGHGRNIARAVLGPAAAECHVVDEAMVAARATSKGKDVLGVCVGLGEKVEVVVFSRYG